MADYKIKLMVLGPVSTNCYILYHENSKEAVIFDPADEPERIVAEIEALGAVPAAILLTHGHFDHILAAQAVRERYKIPLYAHEEETEILADSGSNLSGQFGSGVSLSPDRTVKDGQELTVGGFTFRILHTPGHTRGSVCYYMEQEKLLFSGDTLFAGSIGRTDFPTGSSGVLIRSLKEKIRCLPDDVVVYPGHGEQTDIGYEKKTNPFL